MPEEIPIGQLFTCVYVPRGTPARDSERARRRIAAYFDRIVRDGQRALADYIHIEIGIDVSRHGIETYYQFNDLFLKTGINDFLNAITLTKYGL